ncbi:YidB family protein [Rugamonas brunnea]|nr:YidB family protein [Rugamonas brunnea]
MMGLLDQLVGQVAAAAGGQSQDGAPQGTLIAGVMTMIDNAGGVPALLAQLQASGLGEHVASWIGTGTNLPVSAGQLAEALGAGQLAQVAQQAGVEPEHAASGLAQLLPQLIDQLSPGGQLHEGDLLSQGLRLLAGKWLG